MPLNRVISNRVRIELIDPYSPEYGNVYIINEKDFYSKTILDKYNRHIIIMEYSNSNPVKLGRHIETLLNMPPEIFSKISIYGKNEDVSFLERKGFRKEGIIRSFFNGEDAIILSTFKTSLRRYSSKVGIESELQNTIEKTKENTDGNADFKKTGVYSEYVIKPVEKPDIKMLVENLNALPYQKTVKQESIENRLSDNLIYIIAKKDNRIVSAVSAEIDDKNGNAELTGCSILPQGDGLELTMILLSRLEDMVYAKGISYLYTRAWARLFWTNFVFKRSGYSFTGRLINDSLIGDRFEDMNLWCKTINLLRPVC